MGRKKKRPAPDPRSRIFCYYCDRTFHTEQTLLSHQRDKHLRCPTCHKRMLSIPSMTVHASQMHNLTLSRVPNAIPGRDDVRLDVLGMNGVPDSYYAALDGAAPTKAARAHPRASQPPPLPHAVVAAPGWGPYPPPAFHPNAYAPPAAPYAYPAASAPLPAAYPAPPAPYAAPADAFAAARAPFRTASVTYAPPPPVPYQAAAPAGAAAPPYQAASAPYHHHHHHHHAPPAPYPQAAPAPFQPASAAYGAGGAGAPSLAQARYARQVEEEPPPRVAAPPAVAGDVAVVFSRTDLSMEELRAMLPRYRVEGR